MRFVALVLCALLGSGCTSLRQWRRNGFKVGPNYARPAAPVADAWIDAADPRIQAQMAWDPAWWTVFNDPVLDGLIETAHRQNLDLRTAGTRILEARAQRSIAAGRLFPQSQTAVGGFVHAQVSRNLAKGLGNLPLPNVINLWADGFNASWEPDFWGRFRRGIEAADAGVTASVHDYHDMLVLLLSEVATSYVQLRTFQQRLDYARRNVEIQTGASHLAEARFKDGATTELDVQQASSNLAQTEASIPPLEAGLRQAGNHLCLLLGLLPRDLAAMFDAGPIPVAPVEAAVGLPAELLVRRPDVRRAERELAAQSARIGIATSDLYPRLGVTGFIGYVGDDLKDLFASKSFTGFIIPSFQWNILNYGRIKNNIRLQDARFQGKLLQYRQTVLRAGREVEDGLVGFVQAQRQAQRLELSVRAAERSVELVLTQYRGGVTDFNRVFNTQALLVAQQDQLALARGNIAINLIGVYRALGGGWEYFAQHGCVLRRSEPLPKPPEPLPAPPEPLPKPPAPQPHRRLGISRLKGLAEGLGMPPA